MKRSLIGFSFALLSLAACNKEIIENKTIPVAKGNRFILDAEILQARTTLSGHKVSWEQNDVLYLVTEDGSWGDEPSSVAEFVNKDGKFVSKSYIADGTYTFNALYSAERSKSSHLSAGTTSHISAQQSCKVSNPESAVKDNDALAGQFELKIPAGKATVQVKMHHLYSLLRFDVKNNTRETKTLTKMVMEMTGADLTGDFMVDFKQAKVTPSGNNGSQVTVSIENGTLSAGSSLPVYMVIAPLHKFNGEIKVNLMDDAGGLYSLAKTCVNLTLMAGSLNPTDFSMEVPKKEYQEINKDQWKIALANSQGLWFSPTDENSNWWANNLIDNRLDKEWASFFEGDEVGADEDDYDYDNVKADFKNKTGQQHIFLKKRRVGNILIVIDLGQQTEIHKVGIAHDVNARIDEIEFEVASRFNFKTVKDNGLAANYNTLKEGNTWTPVLTANMTQEKGVVQWFQTTTPVTGRYLKIRPTKSHDNDFAVGLSEISLMTEKNE